MYLVVCRIVSVSAEIQNNERVSEFTDPPPVPEFRYGYVNSETSLNYEFRRT